MVTYFKKDITKQKNHYAEAALNSSFDIIARKHFHYPPFEVQIFDNVDDFYDSKHTTVYYDDPECRVTSYSVLSLPFMLDLPWDNEEEVLQRIKTFIALS